MLKQYCQRLLFVLLFCVTCITSTLAQSQINTGVCKASADAKCLYVSPSGTGDGLSYLNPSSVQQALAVATAGDVVYLLGGVYSQIYDFREQGQTSYYGPKAIINLMKYAPRPTPIPTANSPITIKGYPSETVTLRGSFVNGETAVFIDNRSHYVFENFIVENFVNFGIRAGDDIPREGLTFRNIEIRNIQKTDNPAFLEIHSYDNVIVENCKFHDYVRGDGLGDAGFYIQLFGATDITIRNNEFYGNGGGVNYKHGERTQGAGGFTRIYSNYFHDLTKTGVYTNQNRTDINGNLFVRVGGQSEVYPVVAVHQENGTRQLFTRDVSIAYNTFVDSSPVALNNGSYNPDVGQLGAFDTRVHHNLFSNTEFTIWQYGDNDVYTSGVGLMSEDNGFDMPIGSRFIYYFGSNSAPSRDQGEIHDLASWQNQGFDLNAVQGKPNFTNPTADNYSLQPDSDFIDIGTTAFEYNNSDKGGWADPLQ
jgi:hypothetical protein